MSTLPAFAILLALLHGQGPGASIQNGYEDYLRASRLLDDEFADLYGLRIKRSTIPDSPARINLKRRLDSLDYLTLQEEAVSRYGQALAYVRQGNSKQITNPYAKEPLSASSPFFGFFGLFKLSTAQAYVYFANGNSAMGTQTLLDGLDFSRKVRVGKLLDFIVGVDGSSTIFAEFARRIDNLSEKDARKVAAYVDSALAEVDPYAEALRIDREIALARIPEMFETAQSREPTGDRAVDSYHQLLSKLTPQERRTLAQQVEDGVNRRFSELVQRQRGPESGWYAKPSPNSRDDDLITTMDTAAEFLARILAPVDRSEDQMVHRTQMRLLGLTARVIEFRWKHGKLPATLAEAAPSGLIKDPLSGQEFVFETREYGGFTVYSRGRGELGPITLLTERKGRRDAPVPPK